VGGMRRDKILHLCYPLCRDAIDIFAQGNLVDIGIGDMAGRIIVPADDRRTHAVAFRYIEDRLLAEDLGSPVPDIGIQPIRLSPYFTWRIRRAPGGIRTNGDLIVIDRRPAIL